MLRSAASRLGVCLAVLVGLASCESAAKHPAITIGAVAGTIGFGTCALSVDNLGTCGIVGGSAALVLGGITALVTLLAETNAPPEPDGDLDEEGRPRGSTTEGPPGLPAWMMDGGVAPQTPVSQSDAGVLVLDAAAVDAP